VEELNALAEDGAARDTRKEAYRRLQSLASQYQSVKIAKMAVALTTSGHFDEVIVAIDKMIGELRLEDKEDIEQRDRCQNSQNDNKITSEDLTSDIEKLDNELKRSGDKSDELQAEILSLTESLTTLNGELLNATDLRELEKADHLATLKRAKDGLAALTEAIMILKVFYKEAAKAAAFTQRKASPVDEDTAGAGFSGGKALQICLCLVGAPARSARPVGLGAEDRQD